MLRHATSLLEGDEGLMGISADTRDQLRAEARWILGRALILLGEHQEGASLLRREMEVVATAGRRLLLDRWVRLAQWMSRGSGDP